MDKRVFNALVSVSKTSTAAKVLAAELLTEKTPDLVQRLYDKIEDLERQISELVNSTPEPEELTDDQRQNLYAQTQEMFKHVKVPEDLKPYGYKYLKMFPRHIRLIVAVTLKNKAAELNAQPNDAWLDAIALDGDLK